ncbi:MAG: glycoside hydrolase family 3 C-terminal domain-containing protein [Candidatus Marinimicrobia bacterium]|nr:glycoside hydrolase family 3 C-terminal domain-containing protein [Candidatus Neomarinimicrobiota bacterium]
MAGCSERNSSSMESKVQDLLSKMTLEEKVGQMTQVTLQVVSKTRGAWGQKHEIDLEKLRAAIVKYHVGSILNVYDMALTLDEWQALITQIQDIATKETNLGIPVIYGIDAIHGANYVMEATLFPQSIALAATRNPALVKKSAEITAYEIRAAGIPWNFNPVLGVGRNQLWPRLWETFGEDPYLVSMMGEAYIQGIEGSPNSIGDMDKTAACMKHFIGYTVPLSGKDRTPAWIPERMLRDYFLPPFRKAVEAGVHTVMVNSGEINGIPVHGDHYLLTEVLKNELGFQGFVVSDWADVNNLYTRDKVSASPEAAVKLAVMAGIDMSMVPYDFSFYDILVKLVQDGEVPVARIDDAVSRILRVKFALNLFEKPYPNRKMAAKVGSQESARTSLQAAREALTLLKNENGFLPLKKGLSILVTGPNANLRSVLNGGWTYTWQGNEEAVYPKEKKTILEALQDKIGPGNVVYVAGSEHEQAVNIKAAADAAKRVDVAVVCIGEAPYCETPGNIHDLTLPQAQSDLVAAIQKTGTPVVLVLVEGRPRIITPLVDDAQAILLAYLPGPEGGRAIADVLYGDYNPSGKLPYTYPRYPNDLTNYDHKPIEMDDPGRRNPLWEFGHGLSYTTFVYDDLTIDLKEMSLDKSLNISVNVVNSGDRAGKVVVELYLSDLVRSISPPNKQLKRFTGVPLKPGESKTIQFTLDQTDLSFHNRANEFVAEPGEFKITIGNLTETFTLVAGKE